MTKKELKNSINKSVYQFVETLGYQISDDNDGSYVTFSKPGCKTYKDTIDYMRSEHYVITLNDCSDYIKEDEKLIEDEIKVIREFWNKQYELSK
jgi:hypothetical protein